MEGGDDGKEEEAAKWARNWAPGRSPTCGKKTWRSNAWFLGADRRGSAPYLPVDNFSVERVFLHRDAY